MEKQLPENWVETTLGKISNTVTGNTPSKNNDEFYGNYIPWVKPGDINTANVLYSSEESLSATGLKKARLVPKGSIMVTCIGNLGNVAMAGVDMTTNQQINSIVLDHNLLYDKYLLFYSITLKKWLIENSTSTTISMVNKSNFEKAPILLPPLAEQKRIADKLDILFGQLEAIRKATDHIPGLIKNFRQQILTYAVTGKLTQEWRQGKNFDEWQEKILSDIAIPKSGYAFNASDFTDCGLQVIRMGNLYNNKLSLDRNPVFLPEDYDESIIQKSAVKKDDILLTLTGTKYKKDYGYAIKIDVDDATLLLNQRILSLTSLVNPDFLLIALRGDLFRDQFFSFETGGVNQGNVGVRNVMTITLDIPPIEEQKEIVSRVKSLFEKLETIAQRYQTLKTKLENLPQAILHKAFKGELVEQLPSDGNAADLLREIEQLKQSHKKK